MISASTANKDPRRPRSSLLLDASGASVGDLIFVALAHRFPPVGGRDQRSYRKYVTGIALHV